jgi:hypothetical protein
MHEKQVKQETRIVSQLLDLSNSKDLRLLKGSSQDVYIHPAVYDKVIKITPMNIVKLITN